MIRQGESCSREVQVTVKARQKTLDEQEAVTDRTSIKVKKALLLSNKDVTELICSFMQVVLPKNFMFKSLNHELLNWLMVSTSAGIFLSTCILKSVSGKVFALHEPNLLLATQTSIFFFKVTTKSL